MSSRTPRKVAVSIDVASFEREASLSSWRIGAAALRGKVNKDVDHDTGVQMRQRICVGTSGQISPCVSPSTFGPALIPCQLLMSEAVRCAQ